MEIELISGYELDEAVRELFLEYTQMLMESDSEMAHCLELQGYDKELDDLQYKYGLPDGRLYLAMVGGEPAGCIALRRLDADSCEMKRLFVRPRFRGRGLSKLMIERIIADAKEIGYKAMLLDIVPFLESAVALYRHYGFYDIDCYNDNPIEDTIFMKLDL